MSGGNPQDYHCPLCKGAERVEKVSVLFEASTAIGSYGAEGPGIFLKTAAYSKFAPPSEPTYKKKKPDAFSFLSFLPGWAALIVSISYFLLMFGIPGSIYELAHFGHSSGITYNGQELNIPPFVFVSITIVLLIVLVIIDLTTRPYVKKMKEKKKKLEEESASGHQRWVQAREAWNRLYYCNLHDIVFLPGEKKGYVSASQMTALLYS